MNIKTYDINLSDTEKLKVTAIGSKNIVTYLLWSDHFHAFVPTDLDAVKASWPAAHDELIKKANQYIVQFVIEALNESE